MLNNENENRKRQLEKMPRSVMPFSKNNIICMAVCLALIIIGFMLMSGGRAANPEDFNPEIFSTRRIIVGPLLSFLGFLLMAFAIILPPDSRLFKKKQNNGTPKTTD